VDKVAARLPFSTQEDSFPGNEDVVEKDVSALMHPERRVTDVFVVHGFELCVDAGGVVNMNDALGITGDGKGHCIGFVVGPQRRSRNDKPFMGNRGSGLLEFCVVEAAVLPPLDNPDVKVRVRLAMGRQEAVTYGIRDISGTARSCS